MRLLQPKDQGKREIQRKKKKGARGAILMRLFGLEPMKFPPPLLCLQSSVPPHGGGLIDNLRGKKKWGSDTEAGRDERTGHKKTKLMSNA